MDSKTEAALRDLRIHLIATYGPTIPPAATRVLKWVEALDRILPSPEQEDTFTTLHGFEARRY